MKKLALLLLLTLLPALATAQVQTQPIQNIITSSGTLSATVAATCIANPPTAAAGACGVIPNTYGAYGTTFEEVPNGSPAAVTINVYGCTRGGTCDTVADSNTSTTKANRGVTFTKVYGVFVVLATFSGGTNPTITINPYLSTANNHAAGGSFTAAGDLSGTSSTQEVTGLLSNALPSLSTGFLNWTGSAWALSSAGTGTVTSAVVAGTANQITASGTCTITTTGTCTLSLPSGVTLTAPVLGTPASGVLTNATGYLWNNNTAPTGNLTLANGANTSIFTTTTGVSQFFAWKNNTAALVGASQSSPINSLCGTEWHGGASVEGCLAAQFVPGTGTDAANSFNFTHTGSATGVTTTNFPGPVVAGSSGSNPSAVVLLGNTGTLTPSANSVGFIGPNSASFTSTWYQLSATPPSGTQSLVCGTPTLNISACSFTTVTGGVSSVNTLTGAVVIEAATAGQVAISGGNAAALTGAADLTYATHTFSTTTAGIFDWSAATGTNAIKFPAVIGGTFLGGTSTANLSAPIVIQNTNSSNNNTSITIGVSAPGTSTGQTVFNVNGATTGGDLVDFGTGGTWTNGVLSGQTINFAFTPAGLLKLNAGNAVTAGTGAGTNLGACGTAPTGIASTATFYCNASNFFDIMTATTDLGPAVAEASIIGANLIPKAIGTNPGVAASSITDNGTKVSSTEFIKMGNTQLLTANATPITATTPGTTVFTWGALPVSTNYSFHCAILYNQQTAAVLDGFSVQGATNAPTRLDAWGSMYTTDPITGTVTGSQGSAQNITSTTATSVVTGTPGAITTVYQATLDGTVQGGASATTLNILMFTGSASDSVTPQAGSYCTLTP